MSSSRPRLILLAGGQGVGKDRVSGKLVEQLGLVHVSAGQVLRDRRTMRDPHDPARRTINQIQAAGELASNPVTCNLIVARIKLHLRDHQGVLLDGFPRHPTQSEIVDQIARDCHLHHDVIGFHLTASAEARKARLSGAVKQNERSSRNDNGVEFETREEIYQTQTIPALQAVSSHNGSTVLDVDAEDKGDTWGTDFAIHFIVDNLTSVFGLRMMNN